LYANVNGASSGVVLGVYAMNKHQYTAMQKAIARQENLGLSSLRTKPGDNKGGILDGHSGYSLLVTPFPDYWHRFKFQFGVPLRSSAQIHTNVQEDPI
jgi:hypothetical protein